ncbi:Ankyrin repeat protein 1 [Giardia muris]|uniref:Ankyrin repeat protein 1 n=1 Tax=Giardia muris TaxID=5742 RepID=A0A4Z1T4X4_GIAMU|nr:Ankyrin repeat protein 1 [Giardia muris]|eukprot:TNJ30728.1 Ankyrin repeat protein 1 [Giardia muris]
MTRPEDIPIEARDSHLEEAILRRDFARIRALVSHGNPLSHRQGITHLMQAASRDLFPVIPLLLEQEGRMRDENGWTALMYAVQSRADRCIPLLVSEASLQATRECGEFPCGATGLIIAAIVNNGQAASALQPYESGLLDAEEHTASWHASKRRHNDVLRVLTQELRDIRLPPPEANCIVRFSTAMNSALLPLYPVDQWPNPQGADGTCALMHAARCGNSEAIIQLEHMLELRDTESRTALMYAAMFGQTEVIASLRSLVGLRDNKGWTALMYAVAYNQTHCALSLLEEAGCQATAQRSSYPTGITALMLAASRWNLDIVQELVSNEAMFRDSSGRTALSYAIESNNYECAKKLIGEANLRFDDGQTVLDHASQSCKPELIRSLLMELRNGRDPVETAIELYHYGCVSVLLQSESLQTYSPSRTALMMGAYLGRRELVEQFRFQAGRRDELGRTAIMYAAHAGKSEIVEMLAGLEAEICDDGGQTALMYAVIGGNQACISTLLRGGVGRQANGLDLDYYKIPAGATALMLAAAEGKVSIVHQLLEHESNVRDAHGRTALMYAARHGQSDCVQELLSQAGEQDDEGRTALMYAALAGKYTEVKLLTSREEGKARYNGETTLITAIRNDPINWLVQRPRDPGTKTAAWRVAKPAQECRLEIVSHLAKHELNLTDVYGWSALMHAAYCGDIKCVKCVIGVAGRQTERTHLGYARGATASMIAASRGFQEIVKMLLPYEERILDVFGRDTLWYAQDSGGHDPEHLSVVLTLLQSEPPRPKWTKLMSFALMGSTHQCLRNLNEMGIQDADGRTALMYAAENGFSDIVEVIVHEERIRRSRSSN